MIKKINIKGEIKNEKNVRKFKFNERELYE